MSIGKDVGAEGVFLPGRGGGMYISGFERCFFIHLDVQWNLG